MTIAAPSAETKEQQTGSPLEVLRVFLRLGVTCFGGPIAHIGYFRDEFVLRRHWIDERSYADLVGLCQFLPGPASSQVGFSIGLMRAGYRGGLAAWTGFTLPSAIALVLFAYGAGELGGPVGIGLLHGLKLVGVHPTIEQAERVFVEAFLKQTLLQKEERFLVLGENDQLFVVTKFVLDEEILLDPFYQSVGF